MKRSYWFALSILLFSGATLVAQQQQLSLGDVVRQDKPKKKAARVITDDDMPSRPPESAPAASTTSGAGADVSAKPGEASGEKTAAGAKSGKPDSTEVAEMKHRLIELASDEKGLTSRIGSLEEAASKEQDPSRREIINHQLERTRNSLERARYERGEINKKLEDQKKNKQ